jgi:IPT/TIG domain-containing protein
MANTSISMRIVAASLLLGAMALLSGCGGAGGDSPPDWYYHWDCNGDSECLSTNPTGAASGTLNEGPEEIDCTQLQDFSRHFWNMPPATDSCDHDANGSAGGGTTGVTISAFSPTETAPGTDITIDGSGFTSATTVTVDGVTCTIVSVSDTEIVVTLPGIGNFTGPIVVGGVSSSGSITVVNHFFGVTSSSNQTVAVGTNTTLSGSADGTTWNTVDLASSNYLSAIAASGTNTLVTVGEAGSVYTNPLGTSSFFAHPSGTSQNLFGITWSGTLFAAVGAGGAIITSPDGVTWTARSSHTHHTLAAVAWCATMAQFVAVGGSGVIITSPDGINWTTQISGTTGFLNGVGCSGSLIAVGEGDTTTGGEILSSPDGITWTQRPVAATDAVYGIAWSGTQFVAVGFGGTVYTSSNGTAWTRQSSGSTQSLNAISWSAARAQFVAVGGFGTILTSADGTNWTAHTP